MNFLGKAGRYFIKLDPPGFFRWLLHRNVVIFHAWIDARWLALPDQGDLTNDLVGAFRVGDGFEALCLELQAESEAGSAARAATRLCAPTAGRAGAAREPGIASRRGRSDQSGPVPGGLGSQVGGLKRD